MGLRLHLFYSKRLLMCPLSVKSTEDIIMLHCSNASRHTAARKHHPSSADQAPLTCIIFHPRLLFQLYLSVRVCVWVYLCVCVINSAPYCTPKIDSLSPTPSLPFLLPPSVILPFYPFRSRMLSLLWSQGQQFISPGGSHTIPPLSFVISHSLASLSLAPLFMDEGAAAKMLRHCVSFPPNLRCRTDVFLSVCFLSVSMCEYTNDLLNLSHQRLVSFSVHESSRPSQRKCLT